MKTIKKQIKTIILLLVLALSTNSYAQNEIKKNRMFVRVYNLDGKKLNKGYVASVGDTLLGLKRNGKYTEINVREIGKIKTKRSAGHNILIGTAAGAATGAILGATVGAANDVAKDIATGFTFGLATPDDELFGYTAGEGAITGGLLGGAAGAAVGGISIAFKNSETYFINGSLENWSLFQKRIQK